MSKIIDYFANRKLLVNIITIFIVLIGIYTIPRLKQDAMPQVEMHFLAVQVVYPGAAALDVEVNAIIPIERKIKSISGIVHCYLYG